MLADRIGLTNGLWAVVARRGFTLPRCVSSDPSRGPETWTQDQGLSLVRSHPSSVTISGMGTAMATLDASAGQRGGQWAPVTTL